MNGIQISKNCKGYNINGPETVKGLPLPPGTNVRFAHGIPGFERVTEWCFTASLEVYPFMHFTAVQENVRFVCIDTFRLLPDYRLSLPFLYSEPLAIHQASRLAVLSIVTVGRRPEDTTANLMSPLVVNLDTARGEQIIPDASPYPLKFRIWDTLRLSEARNEPEDELLAAMG